MQTCTDAEFIALWRANGSPTLVSQILKVSSRATLSRRRDIETRYGIELPTTRDLRTDSDIAHNPPRILIRKHEGRIDLSIKDGVVVVFSDAHYWPDMRTTAHRALLAMLRQLKPATVICNGDAFDGGAISRFPRIGWDRKPTVLDELNCCQAMLTEIVSACGAADKIWNLGNHDARYETKLAAMAPEFEGINGFHLKDHFPEWRPAWTTWINDDVLITHRHRNGVHATHTNVQANHCSTVTGHLHSLKVTPYTDGRGVTKYGVDTGTLADPMGPQFVDYMEGRQGNWRSGFAVLTFRDGQMLMPELVQKYDEDTVQFRGHLLHADTGEIV